MLHLSLGTMLSVQLLILFVGSAVAARDATIFVESTVVVIKPLSEVTLPCSYTTDDPDGYVIIRWERGHGDGPVVLLKSSIGNISPGAGYETIADLGENCSLILKNPEPELSGTYTVTVDVHTEVSRDVQLFVFNETTALCMNRTGKSRSNDEVKPVANTTDRKTVFYLSVAVTILASVCILSLGYCLFRQSVKYRSFLRVEVYKRRGNVPATGRKRKTSEGESDDSNFALCRTNEEHQPEIFTKNGGCPSSETSQTSADSGTVCMQHNGLSTVEQNSIPRQQQAVIDDVDVRATVCHRVRPLLTVQDDVEVGTAQDGIL